MCLWLIVGAIMLIRLTASWILLGRFCARASDPPEALRTRAAHWLALCGSKRRNVRVICSTETAIPAAVGPLHPAIVIPARLLGELDENALDQIGLHEAAHLARRDDYALAVQRILEALFALHPVVRWIARRIDLEREIACDDFVLAAKGQSKSYAWCLTRMAELTVGASPSPAAAAATSNLAKRVDILLDKTRHTGTRVLRARLAVVIAALGALAWAVGRSPDLLAFVTPPVQTTPQTAPRPILAPMPARAAEIPQRPASDKPPATTAPPEIAATVALQTEPAGQAVVAPPSFEVASVKPAAPTSLPDFWYGMTGGPGTSNPGQFTCTHISLRPLLLMGYDLRSYQLAGPPSIDGDKYDVVAKIPPGATKEQVNRMLQNLLVERFGLAVHRETRDLPIYEMVVAKGGLKLREPEKPPNGEPAPVLPERTAGGAPASIKGSLGKDGSPELPPGMRAIFLTSMGGSARILARMQTVDALLRSLETYIGRPVVDKTGVTGTYDFNLSFAPDPAKMVYVGLPAAPEPPSGQAGPLDAVSDPVPTLLVALESQLGLKLEPKRGPVDILVVDHVNRTPTEN
jgi:uncharacterized protein (TIGR03435 family)